MIKRYALKCIEKRNEEDETVTEMNEIETLKKTSHDNIVKYFEHFEATIDDSLSICIVLEFCEVLIHFFNFNTLTLILFFYFQHCLQNLVNTNFSNPF